MDNGIHALERFSFFDRATSDLWAVDASGVWADDNLKGRAIANELIADMQTGDFPGMLSNVAGAITLKGRHGGVEVGFWFRIAAYLL